MLLNAFLTALFFAISATANPVQLDKSLVSLSLARRLNLTSVHNLVRHHQARAKYLKNRATSTSASTPAAQPGISEPVDNQAVTYVATIGVGSPATDYSLIVDTGSSNTWVGTNLTKSYMVTSSSQWTGHLVSVTYRSGSLFGLECYDKVTIAPALVIPKQSIGAPVVSSGFSGEDGILGTGPVDLTSGTLDLGLSSATIPTVTDNLFSNGLISNNEIGISFEPTTVSNVVNGEITWGGTDATKYTGEITYTPVTSTSPASKYWGINQYIRYGESTTILNTTAGIVDTGTTLIMIATNAFNAYKAATEVVPDSTTSLLTITPTQFALLQSLFFIVGGTTFELTPNAQIWPRSLNSDIGGSADQIYLIVGDIGSDSGTGLDFINGYAFLERFYSVYDTGKKRVGLATTSFTNATTN